MYRFLLLFVLTGLLASCVGTNAVRLGARPANISEMAFASPVSFIVLPGLNQPPIPYPQATNESVRLMHKIVVRHRFQLRLRSELVLPDSLRWLANQEIFRTIDGITSHHKLGREAMLPVLDYLAAQQAQRYILVTAADGYTLPPPPVQHNVSQQAFYTRVGYQMRKSNLYVFIYDSQQRAIVYYVATPRLAKREPLDEASLEEQFSKLLTQDFPIIFQ